VNQPVNPATYFLFFGSGSTSHQAFFNIELLIFVMELYLQGIFLKLFWLKCFGLNVLAYNFLAYNFLFGNNICLKAIFCVINLK